MAKNIKKKLVVSKSKPNNAVNNKLVDAKELEQTTIIINGKKTVVPPYVAINIEASNT